MKKTYSKSENEKIETTRPNPKQNKTIGFDTIEINLVRIYWVITL